MIYCTGDSFTAGTELVDSEYFTTSYPGTFDKEYNKNVKHAEWWNKTVIKDFIKLPHVDRCEKLNKEKMKAWPAKLEKLINVPIINSGCMGASIEFLVRSTITDVLLSTNSIETVIVQLPPVERIEVTHYNKFYSSSIADIDHWIPNVQTILKAMVLSETRYTLQRRYLFSLIQLADFCKNNNIKLIVVAVSTDHMVFDNELDHLTKYIADTFCPHVMYTEVEKLYNDVFCPGGHFTEKVHDSFSQTLADYLKEQNIL